jgi:DNA-binding beta-propeller fold protein YncE
MDGPGRQQIALCRRIADRVRKRERVDHQGRRHHGHLGQCRRRWTGHRPVGVAVTSDGGFLIADTNNHVVRKVSAGGVITRVAGTMGTLGSGGDDGPATDAQFSGPQDVAVTADGGMLIADTGNHVVRKTVPIP